MIALRPTSRVADRGAKRPPHYRGPVGVVRRSARWPHCNGWKAAQVFNAEFEHRRPRAGDVPARMSDRIQSSSTAKRSRCDVTR